ncbi:MAG: hypothetical protein ACFFE4_16380 [Candidatus Thorarchaeota archaeon]
MMTKGLPKELTHARELMDQAKLDEILEIIEEFEKNESLAQEDKLSALLIKAKVFEYTQKYEICVEINERAYQLSQDLGLVSESVEALIGKANLVFTGDLDKASTYIDEAERIINSIDDNTLIRMLRRSLLFIKSWILVLNANFIDAEEWAQENLKLTKEEKLGNKFDLAHSYNLLGWIYTYQGHQTKALDYAMKSLKHNKRLNHGAGIANNYGLIATIYNHEGDYDRALKYCKDCLSIKQITKLQKLIVSKTMAQIYFVKSEFNRVMKYIQQAVAIAEELNAISHLIQCLNELGYYNRIIGKKDLAIESFERSLVLSEKWGLDVHMANSLSLLTMVYIDERSRKKANRYFSRLSELYNQTKNKGDTYTYFMYLSSKAYMMKTSSRIRDRMESQALYRDLIDSPLTTMYPENLNIFLGNLCDLLLEELSMNNEPEILDEITPLLTKSLDLAENTKNYYWLAETKLLHAKLALIEMNIEEAKRLMVEAQRIADLRGLNLLASEISSEHDNLLKQVKIWDTLKKDDAPMAERIKLALTNGVLERIQGKRAVEAPELVKEEPILLLIMDNSGATYFNHHFIVNWDHSDLFSSFMSAFNTFMDEIFSKSIDRIRIGENTILVNPLEQFLVCYVIKGQSYPALQKLTRFTEAIRENSAIWQALNKSVKTSEMLDLDKPPVLKTVINEIFTH